MKAIKDILDDEVKMRSNLKVAMLANGCEDDGNYYIPVANIESAIRHFCQANRFTEPDEEEIPNLLAAKEFKFGTTAMYEEYYDIVKKYLKALFSRHEVAFHNIS